MSAFGNRAPRPDAAGSDARAPGGRGEENRSCRLLAFGREPGGLTMNPYVAPIVMLSLSNVFMTFAWYGHLKFKMTALWVVVLISWGIAFFEYWLAVPANRIGHEVYSAAQLKTIQEVITLTVFAGFSVLYLKESISWGVLAGFVLIAAGAALVFRG